jgi:uncharacterized protein (DUF1800 family)
MQMRFLTSCVTMLLALVASAPRAQVGNCPFNVDGVGTAADALRDGVVLVRYAQGMRGAPLIAGTSLVNATTVANNIAANLDRLDIDSSGRFDALDASIISRVLFAFNTSAAPITPTSDFATRDTANAIKAYLDGGCTSSPLLDQQRASKFLTQATFGPSSANITALLALAEDASVTGSVFKRKASTWINNQFTTPRLAQKHYDYIVDYAANVCTTASGCTGFGSEATRHSFWKHAITGNDQLRQRVAFALSQIAVVSSNGNSSDPYELAAYLDMLNDNAYLNFRDILNGVVRSPAMGRYLDHLRNDGGSTTPNENFAREVLQLFSVGLVMLNADGSETNTPTYTEDTVKGFAKVFTGMSFDDQRNPTTGPRCLNNTTETIPAWNWSPDSRCYPDTDTTPIGDLNGWRRPMVTYIGRHSNQAKQLLQYDTLSAASSDARCSTASMTANQNLPAIAPEVGVTTGTKVSKATADAMIARAVDNIFCHPNVGPFIGKQLIHMLVTSTPTPAYVTRVTNVFNNNGSGLRGDMKAVIRAVLLDEEALNPGLQLSLAERPKFGKLREPILRLSALLRAFPRPATPANSGRYFIDGLNSVEFGVNQGPLQSPSVFNYYHPDFAPPGPIAQANALGPEFEITTTTSIAATQNFYGGIVTQGSSNVAVADYGRMYNSYPSTCNPTATPAVYTDCIFMNYVDLYPIAADTSALLDYLNLVLMGGKLAASVKANYIVALDTAYSPNFTGLTGTTLDQRKRDRVKSALWLAVHSPEFQVQY